VGATSGNQSQMAEPRNGSNGAIRNRWQPTATVSERMVRRGSTVRVRQRASFFSPLSKVAIARTESKGRKGMPQIVDPPKWIDADSALNSPPLMGADVVDIQVVAALPGKEHWRSLRRFAATVGA
jgi:hypothetical protein